MAVTRVASGAAGLLFLRPLGHQALGAEHPSRHTRGILERRATTFTGASARCSCSPEMQWLTEAAPFHAVDCGNAFGNVCASRERAAMGRVVHAMGGAR
jgi:hypothetical protein